MVRKSKTILLFAVLCMILAVGQWYNGAYAFARTKTEWMADADWVSDNILLADLLYAQHYRGDMLFARTADPPAEAAGRAAYFFEDALMNGTTLPEERFWQYTSNIVAQRFLYRWLDKVLPLPPIYRLRVMELMTSVLTAAAVAAVLLWLGEIVNGWAAVTAAVLLSFACPYFTIFGKNLYWAPWTFWLPAAAMALLAGSRRFSACRHSTQALLLLAVSFVTCLWKQLCYFEFTSTAMIAMSIPVIYWLLLSEKTRRQKAELFLSVVAGGLSSFAVAFYAKYRMLVHNYGAAQAVSMIETNLLVRVGGGDVNNSTPIIAASAKASVFETIGMLSKRVLVSATTAVGAVELTGWGCLLLLLVLTLPAVWARYKAPAGNRKYGALLCCTWISVLAPLSWFVRAKPHAYIHTEQCSTLWYCPFIPMVVVVLWAAVQNHIAGCRADRQPAQGGGERRA